VDIKVTEERFVTTTSSDDGLEDSNSFCNQQVIIVNEIVPFHVVMKLLLFCSRPANSSTVAKESVPQNGSMNSPKRPYNLRQDV
jgi:hypothetical protein